MEITVKTVEACADSAEAADRSTANLLINLCVKQ